MSLEQYQQKRQLANLTGAVVALNMARSLATDLLVQAVIGKKFDDPTVDSQLRRRINDKLKEIEPVTTQEFLTSYFMIQLPATAGDSVSLAPDMTPDTHRLDMSGSVAVYNHSYETVMHVVLYVPRLEGLIAAGNSFKIDRILMEYHSPAIKSLLSDSDDDEMVAEIVGVSVVSKGILVIIRHPRTRTLFAVNVISCANNYKRFRARYSKSLVDLPRNPYFAAIDNPRLAISNYCEAADEFNRAALPDGYQNVSKEDFQSLDDVISSVLNDQDRFFSDLLCRDIGVRLLAAECGLDCNVSSFDFELANKMHLARYLALCMDSAALDNLLPEIPEWASYITRCT